LSTKGAAVFETARLVIKKATVADVDTYLRLWNDPRVMTNVGFPQGLRISREKIEEQMLQQPDSEFDRLLVVQLKETGEPIGECKLGRPDAGGIAETDIKLLPAYWGHKYGVETKWGLLSYLFSHTNCDCVQATPNVNNIASVKMQEAVGGVRVDEGIYQFPESMREFTTPVHHYVYRVYRTDWETDWRGRK
jgi:RimJ/RimL family protein N-acetyltransferase